MPNAGRTSKPKIAEAVDIMTRLTITREQKLANMAHWKRLYGDEYHDRIMNELRAKKKGAK